MQDENYITIQGWMRNVLDLKGNELMVYALIYGFSQDGETEFTGSAGYIAEWIGSTKRTVFNILETLTDRKLLEKTEKHNNGVKFCTYKISPVVKNFHRGSEKISSGGSEKISPNNIVFNNIDNNIDKENIKRNICKDIVDEYNITCDRLAKAERLTEGRKKHIKARLDEFSREEMTMAFCKANESDFLCGLNDRGFKADLDWLIKNSDNITKVLEGKYDNRRTYSKTEQELMAAYNHIQGGSEDDDKFGFGI